MNLRVALLSLDEAYAVDIGLRIISALLKGHGHEVDMLFNVAYLPGLSSFSTQTFNPAADNFKNIDQAAGAVADFVIENHSELLGISVSTGHFERAARITRKVKELKPDIFIIWGGVHPTVRPGECLDYADCICIGEGERPMLELVNRLSRGTSIYNIPGLWFKDDNGIIKNEVGPMIEDIDSLPFQDYDLKDHYLIKEDIGIKPLDDTLMSRIMPTFVTKISPSYALYVTRGCPYSCGYCINSFVNRLYGKHPSQNIVRRRSVENVILELDGIKKKFPFFDSVFFIDDLFVFGEDKNKWLEDFSRQYREKISLPFMCLMHFSQVNDKTMELLVSAGLRQVSIGIESGSERTLKNLYNRHFMPEAILDKARIVNKYKQFIVPSYDVILDNPYESTDDLRKTLEFIFTLPEPFHLGLYHLTFFPGVPLSEKARADGLITDELKQVYRKHYNDVDKSGYFNRLFIFSLSRNTRHVCKRLITYFLRHPGAIHKFLFSLLFYRPWNFYILLTRNKFYQRINGFRLKNKYSRKSNVTFAFRTQ